MSAIKANRAMKTPLLSLAVILLHCLPSPAQEGAPAANPPPADAYETVKKAEVFTIGGVGFTGRPSREELAFRELLTQPRAQARLEKLLAEASLAGQLYALLGLRQADPKAFSAALPRYRDSKAPVQTMEGCNMFKTDAATISRRIEKGELK